MVIIRATVQKWGKVAAIRLPQECLDLLGIGPGQDVEVELTHVKDAPRSR